MARVTHLVPEMSIFWSKSGVQRWSHSETMCIAKENLIRYSESQENFPSKSYTLPISLFLSSGSKLRLKMPRFHFVATLYHFLCIELSSTYELGPHSVQFVAYLEHFWPCEKDFMDE